MCDEIPMHLSQRSRTRTPVREPVPVTVNAERPLPNARRASPGAPTGNKNAFRYGRYAADAIARRRDLSALVQAMKSLAKTTG